VEVYGLDGPVSRWQRIRAEIRADVLAHGFNTERLLCVQYYGSDQTDAALLQIVQVGFLPPDDPRVLGTIVTIRPTLRRALGPHPPANADWGPSRRPVRTTRASRLRRRS
jgi:GH15 family glucan-1,4-alpha-glucosidase